MVLPKLKREYFGDTFFSKKKTDCINYYLRKRGIDQADEVLAKAEINNDRAELQKLQQRKMKNPSIVIPSKLYELDQTDMEYEIQIQKDSRQ